MRHILLTLAMMALAASGCTGEQGVIGEMGSMGTPGPQGERGEQGIQGDLGPEGPEGPQGMQGIQGDVGPQGLEGPQGLQGVQGDPGPQGSQGIQGMIGPMGPAGPQGTAGADGADGPQGPSGVVRSYSVDADFTTEVPTIAVGSAYLPASCAIVHTAGANEVAVVNMQTTVQFGAADVLSLGPAFNDGTGPVYAVAQGAFDGTGALNVANVSASARIPLTSGVNYTFQPGIAAVHDAGVDLSVLLGICHATVKIVTESGAAPLIGGGYGDTLQNPITGAPITIK